MPAYAEVVVTLPVEGRFHYAVPPHLEGALRPGHRVLVPFGPRRVTGFVVSLTDEVPPGLEDKIRPIAERLDPEPLLEPELLRLATFTADYYLATVGEVLRLALPPGVTGASRARWAITAAGRHFLESGRDVLPGGGRLTTAMRRLLEAAVQRPVATGDAAPQAALALETAGFLARKEASAARAAGGEVEIIERAVAPDAAEPHLGRSPLRRRLFAQLAAGPMVSGALATAMGGRRQLTTALGPLEGAGVVRRRRVPAEAAPRVDLPGAGGADLGSPSPSEALPELTAEQADACAAITARLDTGEGGAFLLHGVTASGKTEVYLRAIAHARATGRGAIVLVPEIALTPQLEARFSARFGAEVAVLHSALPDRERRLRWQRLHAGEASIALGPRSAIWAPVRRLGIVVVDEEHDPSFKQNSDVRYNGRDLALVRAHQARAVAVLGSATPSLEALNLVERGRILRLRMRERVLGRPLPTVQVVDLTEERRAMRGALHVLSRALADRLRAVVGAGEQAILFLNRRGFNTVVYCEECSAPRSCLHCDVALTFHKQARNLSCHYCGHVEPLEAPCRKCKGLAMQPFGVGTERLVEAVREVVPDARVLRLDRDVTARAGELDRTLAAFRNGEADVLVGTQMVAKGHDFPRVTLVGIVLADASLAFPDFRAAERTFQLLTQVAGRAGRAGSPGHVVIQTLQPDHYALTCATHHDSDRFFELERVGRKSAAYPPYARMGLVRIESRDEALVAQVAAALRRAALRHGAEQGVRVRGPVPAPIPRIRDRHRQMLMVLAPTPARLVTILSRVRSELRPTLPRRVDLIFDVDPVDLL